MKLLSSLLLVTVANGRGCPNVSYEQQFDLESYFGTWYEAFRHEDVSFENGECVVAKYSLRDDGLINIDNTLVRYNEDTRSGGLGWARQKNKDKNEGTLEVKFSKWNPFWMNYSILETDYENYSVLYNCVSFFWGFYKTEYAWLLTRN